MSTDYRLNDKVSAHDLFDERLKMFGIQEYVMPKTDERSRCLTDGRNYLWVHLTEDGFVGCLSRYGANAPGKILDAIAETFNTEIFSEYEPQFWGFDTKEEWDAAMQEMADQHREEFYADVCAYVRGEPNDIRPGTIGEIQANIAKTLVEQNPALLSQENKDKLLAEMEAIYDRDHTVTVTLSPEDLAFARMIATHEEDLPQC
jgi:hypothetical protein